MTATQASAGWWERFRAWRWWALTAVAAIVWVGLAVTGGDDGSAEVTSGDGTTTTEAAPTTTERQTTTTESIPEAPEGGVRSGDAEDVDAAHDGDDTLSRSPDTNAMLLVLASLPVQTEEPRTGYSRDQFPHWDDEDGDGCDSRCEVLSAQRHSDGTWLSEWDGYSTDDPSELHVDHVVALAEAWDSGARSWSAARRDEFADYHAEPPRCVGYVQHDQGRPGRGRVVPRTRRGQLPVGIDGRARQGRVGALGRPVRGRRSRRPPPNLFGLRRPDHHHHHDRASASDDNHDARPRWSRRPLRRPRLRAAHRATRRAFHRATTWIVPAEVGTARGTSTDPCR